MKLELSLYLPDNADPAVVEQVVRNIVERQAALEPFVALIESELGFAPTHLELEQRFSAWDGIRVSFGPSSLREHFAESGDEIHNDDGSSIGQVEAINQLADEELFLAADAWLSKDELFWTAYGELAAHILESAWREHRYHLMHP